MNLELLRPEEIDNIIAYERNNPIRNRKQMIKGKAVTTEKMDDEMKEIHSSRKYKEESVYKLKEILLDIGGEEANMLENDPDTEKLLSRGQLWYGDNIEIDLGEPCQCHKNSCSLWEYEQDNTVICTGYALSYDGLWRPHSWVIRVNIGEDIKLIETTKERVAYYGYGMTYKEAERFCIDNS